MKIIQNIIVAGIIMAVAAVGLAWPILKAIAVLKIVFG